MEYTKPIGRSFDAFLRQKALNSLLLVKDPAKITFYVSIPIKSSPLTVSPILPLSIGAFEKKVSNNSLVLFNK